MRRYHISIGDFNSHSTLWGYEVNDRDGDEVETWLESKHLTLIHDAKLPKSFNSARWKRGYNPDLVSSRAVKEVLDLIPHTQHRPITITIRSSLQATTVPFCRRFNLRKTQKTNAAVEQYRPCPTYWNVMMPPSAAPKTWLNQPHYL
ncbi:hypothetical protein ABVT39_000762 [Epinephelus coioides]